VDISEFSFGDSLIERQTVPFAIIISFISCFVLIRANRRVHCVHTYACALRVSFFCIYHRASHVSSPYSQSSCAIVGAECVSLHIITVVDRISHGNVSRCFRPEEQRAFEAAGGVKVDKSRPGTMRAGTVGFPRCLDAASIFLMEKVARSTGRESVASLRKFA